MSTRTASDPLPVVCNTMLYIIVQHTHTHPLHTFTHTPSTHPLHTYTHTPSTHTHTHTHTVQSLTSSVILKSSPGEYSNSSNFIITDAKMRDRAVGLLRKLEKNGENGEGKWGEW